MREGFVFDLFLNLEFFMWCVIIRCLMSVCGLRYWGIVFIVGGVWVEG